MITFIGKCENCDQFYGSKITGTLQSIYDLEASHKCVTEEASK